MPRRLHYFAQPFFAGRRDAAQRFEFVCAVDAEEGGAILAKSADGVLVYQQWVDAEADVFEDPETLAVIGEVPAVARAIDPDGPEPWAEVA